MLERLCRVCGRCVTNKSVKTKYLCQNFRQELTSVFEIDIQMDDPNIHPSHFCHACKRVLTKAGPSYNHRTAVFEGWTAHEVGCTVCEHYSRIQLGGRPPKRRRTPGRPPNMSPRYCIEHIRQVAPPPFTPPDMSVQVCELHLRVPASQFNCPLCKDLLKSPVQLATCGSVVCAECLCSRIGDQESLLCPCCNLDHIDPFSSITPAPPLVVNVIGSLCVVCKVCNTHIQLREYRDHDCNSPQEVLPHTSIDEILSQLP